MYPKELESFENDIFQRNFASRTIDTYYQIGYWRKANGIHKWFVDNCGEGNDNCEKYFVGSNKLFELRKICEEILKDKSKAKDLLPTEEGFFFGTTEYDDWYYEDVKYTLELVNKVIAFMKTEQGKDYEVIYQASW